MAWLSALFLLLLAVLTGWIPLLGPLALGFFAARSTPGPRAVLVALPGLTVIVAGWLTLRAAEQTAERYGLSAWLWTAVSWLISPLGTWLGRPLTQLIGESSAQMFALLIAAPLLVGLLAGALTRRR